MIDEKSSFQSMVFVVEHDSLTMEIMPAALKRCLATAGNRKPNIGSKLLMGKEIIKNIREKEHKVYFWSRQQVMVFRVVSSLYPLFYYSKALGVSESQECL